MTSKIVGLIPSPDLPADLAFKIKDKLKLDLNKHVDQDVEWEVEIDVDPLTGSAEYVNEVIDKAVDIKDKKGWDYAVCLTDLPSLSNNKVVTSDVSVRRQTGLISLPSFGAFPLKKRIRKAITYVVDLMYTNDGLDDGEEQTASHLKWRFLFSRVKRVKPEDDNKTDNRFILQSRIIGWLRLLSGMTFANKPWTALGSFTKVLTLAFATGTYISIFSTPWQLSVAYSIPRFLLLMLLSIAGMVIWIIFAHKLWEKPTDKGQSQFRKLYNLTTVATLTVIVLINYAVLYILFMISIAIFVPENLFEGWTQVDAEASIQYFVRLAWLATSLGTLAGAVGATGEKEERIKHITYSYRQLTRSYELKKKQEKSKSSDAAERDESQVKKQAHEEGELS
ncbi:hypothetical protein JNUCC1_02411 [Lentibacillus sp. JNUCC-1]|uniref:5,10-methylene-tetrahydrofolate dehydrogenase n=1 Tax=Lentibacillus sp. JNUCC-1 TaxID=2654513 RepID=UPI0012E84CFD|nr:5,10-methylene-tetrahydrofolate dehydrogenase [Lentibacillus sp. JNUCC-1]MUV38557.1 hypothetical protein [Lentibacillus sp. JNUCC-1]